MSSSEESGSESGEVSSEEKQEGTAPGYGEEEKKPQKKTGGSG